MRLWHYKLIPYLPNKMLISEWRELIAVKRQWEKGTLKHKLVSYVMNREKITFYNYILDVIEEMRKRHIKFQEKLLHELFYFCEPSIFKLFPYNLHYLEHNDRYLKQCLYNLEEKYDRGIIAEEEWKIIEDNFKEYLDQ